MLTYDLHCFLISKVHNYIRGDNNITKTRQQNRKLFYYGAYVDGQGLKHQYKKRGFNSKREASKAEDKFRDDVESGKIIRNKKTIGFMDIQNMKKDYPFK